MLLSGTPVLHAVIRRFVPLCCFNSFVHFTTQASHSTLENEIVTCSMKKCPWREAATLILTSLKKPPSNLPWNYELVVLKRSAESSFMPNRCVFPGGVVEQADCNEAWLDLFSDFKLDLSSLTKITGEVPPIIAENIGKVPKLLTLKIAALRETFEETGVLLCFGKDKKSPDSEGWATSTELQDLDLWKQKVHENANEFFNMCVKHSLCPDVKNIHLWSNWLSPSQFSKRFDTAFFFACVRETPAANADFKEISNLGWFPPDKLTDLCKNQVIWLPPPQIYEMSRLYKFKDINELIAFAQNRAVQGCERWTPNPKKTADGTVSLLPGDDAYETSEVKPSEKEVLRLSTEEFRKKYEVLHRLEARDNLLPKIVLKNYKPRCGHVLPAEEFCA